MAATNKVMPSLFFKVRSTFFAMLYGAALLGGLGGLGGLAGTAEARVFKIVTIGGSPFGVTDSTGQPRGVNVEIGNLIVEEAGLRFENTVAPYARALAMIESGAADFMIAYPNNRLDVMAQRVGVVARLENVVIGRAGSTFRSLRDLQGKTVASVREAEYDSALSADRDISKYSTNNYQQGISMLLAGRLDAIVGMKAAILYQVEAMHIPRTQLSEPLVLNQKDAWLFFSNSSYDPGVAARLKTALSNLTQRNALRQIEQKYFGSPEVPVR